MQGSVVEEESNDNTAINAERISNDNHDDRSIDSDSNDFEEEEEEALSVAMSIESSSSSSSRRMLPLAREHSYLPGICHPLSVVSRDMSSSYYKYKEEEEILAILELKDIFLFPGGTLPLRLRDRKWIEYLGRKIDASRGIIPTPTNDTNKHVVRIGIMTNIEESSNKKDEWIGRIGTFATIMYTHEEQNINTNTSSSSSSSVWQRHDGSTRQLIVTAAGTGRFQIISRIPNNNDHDDYNSRNNHNNYYSLPQQHNRNVRLFSVRELHDSNIIMKHHHRQQRTAVEKYNDKIGYDQCDNNIMTHLSLVSHIPLHVYKAVWPWKLVNDIRMELSSYNKHHQNKYRHNKQSQKESFLVGFFKMLPSEVTDDSADPCDFSFWMASNIPLISKEDRMDLLTSDNVILRLKLILKIIRQMIEEEKQEEEEEQKSILCKGCGNPIAYVHSLFQVAGAEGTTGAYVNEYGVIHQTMTVRDVIHLGIIYMGGPETKDSWFPGYAWTIACCRYCRSHLGWKFTKVKLRGEENDSTHDSNKDRPQVFWGMSASNITTEITTNAVPISDPNFLQWYDEIMEYDNQGGSSSDEYDSNQE